MPHSSDPAKNAAYMREYRRSEAGKAYYFRHHRSEKYKERKRRSEIKTTYGITVEQYDAMLLAQSNGCAICGRPAGQRRLPIDHDHSTGKVRALLCEKHNIAVGVLEAPDLSEVKAYIEKWKTLHSKDPIKE